MAAIHGLGQAVTQLANLKLDDLSDDERRALRAYKAASSDEPGGSSPCFELNRELRSGLWKDETGADLRWVADALDQVFERCPRLENGLIVHRAIGSRQHLPLLEVNKLFRSLEYWSTALSDDRMESFLNPISNDAYGAILDLHLPAGTPAYNMETLEGFGGHEAELLLPRGMLWTVVDFKMDPMDKLSSLVRDRFKNIARVELRAEPWRSPRT
ncbi:MAG: ADP-ribosyltransferase [Devosia sp.]|nr:ADP-ribosyltransferase [Devosia sp.]